MMNFRRTDAQALRRSVGQGNPSERRSVRASELPSTCSGTTLIELIVALAVLGIVLGVSTAALSAIHRDVPPPRAAAIAAARTRALRQGSTVQLDLPDSSGHGVTSLLFLPDGRIVGVGFDPLTGEAADARR